MVPMQAQDAAVAAAQEGAVVPLPDPEAVAEAYRSMETAVRSHWEMWQARAEGAKRVLDEAVEEQRKLVESYPQFFPAEQGTDPGEIHRGKPSTEQMNVMLRAVAEHPGDTYRQLARRLNISRSWCGRIIQVINEHGEYVANARAGRELSWTLTPAGEQFLNRGGFHS